jgi:hypothetical protein
MAVMAVVATVATSETRATNPVWPLLFALPVDTSAGMEDTGAATAGVAGMGVPIAAA